MRHGALYGAIIGDVVGSIYEFHNVKSKDFPLLTEKSHFTDDTAMTIAVANALIISGKDDISGFQSNLISEMQRIGRKYPNAGYAGKFSKWLNSESPVPYESFGNGSAMRVSPCALVADSMEEAEAIAEASASVTHNHPEGIKGAKAVASSIWLAKDGADKADIRAYVEDNYYPLEKSLDDIRKGYSFDMTCLGSVPQAITVFLESEDFEDAIRNAISIGGDSDTIADMAAAIAWPYYSKNGISERMHRIYENVSLRLPDDFKAIADSFSETMERKNNIITEMACKGSVHEGSIDMAGIIAFVADIVHFSGAMAIVNSTNPKMQGLSGLDKVITKEGGKELKEEYSEVSIKTMRPGETRVTSAPNLGYEYIIHTYVPKFKESDPEGSFQKLEECYINIMKAAEKEYIRSIAIPSLGTGNNRFPSEKAAQIAVKTINEYLQGHDTLDVVFLILSEGKRLSRYTRIMDREGIEYLSYKDFTAAGFELEGIPDMSGDSVIRIKARKGADGGNGIDTDKVETLLKDLSKNGIKIGKTAVSVISSNLDILAAIIAFALDYKGQTLPAAIKLIKEALSKNPREVLNIVTNVVKGIMSKDPGTVMDELKKIVKSE